MRFPLRFTADLQLGIVARTMRAGKRQPLVLELASYSDESAALFPSLQSTARMVWIGGAEPLEHPDIPRYVNDLASRNREVFLYTDGSLLRRRIHEFQPSSCLRFVLSFDGASSVRNGTTLEAIRVAKLSGFLVCVLTTLHSPEGFDGLTALHRWLHELDLDGYLIVPAAHTPELKRAVARARHTLLNRRWSRVSAMFDSAVLPASTPASATYPKTRNVAAQLVETTRRDFEEGAQAG
jgi:hypothetical protein